MIPRFGIALIVLLRPYLSLRVQGRPNGKHRLAGTICARMICAGSGNFANHLELFHPPAWRVATYKMCQNGYRAVLDLTVLKAPPSIPSTGLFQRTTQRQSKASKSSIANAARMLSDGQPSRKKLIVLPMAKAENTVTPSQAEA